MPGTIAHSRRTEPSRAALGPSSATAAVPILAHTHHAFAMLAGTKAKRGAFADQYRTLCTYAKQYPLSYVLTPTFHHSVTLRVPADKVVTESDWDLLLASLAMADDLRGVCIWSVWWFEKRRTLAKLPAEKDAKRVKDNLRAKIPLVLHAEIAEPLVRAVAGAMRQCKLLATVALAGVILRPASVRLLAAALVRSSSLCTLSLARCEIGDEGFHELAGAIKSSQSLQILDLADNHLTHQSASLLADALKSQSVRRVEAAFPHLLRSGSSRTNMNLALHRKSFDSAFGSSLPPHHHNQHHPSDHADPNLHHAARPTTVVIKRVTLSCNPLGDAGLYHLLDALQSDIGVQALDLQHTRITNHGAEAALMVLSDVEGAAALDIRNNADVDPLLIKQVTEIGAAQCAHDPELARLPDGAHPLDSSLFRAAVPSRPAATGTATSRTVTHSGSEKPRTRTAPRPPALPRAAWRPAGKLPPPTVTTASLAAKQTKKRAEERTHLGWNPLVSVVDLVDVMETNRQLEGKVMALESAVLRHAQESPIVVAVPAGQQQPEYDSYDWDPRFARAAGYGGNGMVASSYQQYPQQQQALHYDSETDAMYRPADRPITPYAALGPMHPSGGAEPEYVYTTPWSPADLPPQEQPARVRQASITSPQVYHHEYQPQQQQQQPDPKEMQQLTELGAQLKALHTALKAATTPWDVLVARRELAEAERHMATRHPYPLLQSAVLKIGSLVEAAERRWWDRAPERMRAAVGVDDWVAAVADRYTRAHQHGRSSFSAHGANQVDDLRFDDPKELEERAAAAERDARDSAVPSSSHHHHRAPLQSIPNTTTAARQECGDTSMHSAPLRLAELATNTLESEQAVDSGQQLPSAVIHHQHR